MIPFLTSDYHAALAGLTILIMFIFFLKESFPPELVALGGAAFMLSCGILPYEIALSVFSNPAPWTIAAMFILSTALMRTGLLSQLSRFVTYYGEKSPKLTLMSLGGFILLSSAFMNNTPVVVIMIPIAIQMARLLGVSPSKLLIPLSYLAIFGGLCTLIGTSSNLLVDGIAKEAGLAPFTLFEVTPMALILALFGLLYLRIFAPALLPDRASMADMLGRVQAKTFLSEMTIPKGSKLIGMQALQVDIFNREGARVYDVMRSNHSQRHALKSLTLKAYDKIILRTKVGGILSLRDNDDVELITQLDTVETTIIEALIPPNSALLRRSLSSLQLQRRYGVYPLALHRKNVNISDEFEEINLAVGDTLLLEGEAHNIHKMAEDLKLTELSIPTERAFRWHKAPLVLGALASVIALAAFNIAPIFLLAIIAVAFVFLTRSIDADEGFGSVDGRLLVLIFSMLAVGMGLQSSGAIEYLIVKLTPLIEHLPLFFILWVIFLITSLCTELISNNAVAVVMTPIVIGLAQSLGCDPRPFVVLVMIAASASFATPIGYQTNTLVYGAGGYSFIDFVKIGAPLNITLGLLTSFLVPLFWPIIK